MAGIKCIDFIDDDMPYDSGEYPNTIRGLNSLDDKAKVYVTWRYAEDACRRKPTGKHAVQIDTELPNQGMFNERNSVYTCLGDN